MDKPTLELEQHKIIAERLTDVLQNEFLQADSYVALQQQYKRAEFAGKWAPWTGWIAALAGLIALSFLSFPATPFDLAPMILIGYAICAMAIVIGAHIYRHRMKAFYKPTPEQVEKANGEQEALWASRQVEVLYNMDEGSELAFTKLKGAFEMLNSSVGKWEFQSQVYTGDVRYNANCGTVIDNQMPFSVNFDLLPKALKINVGGVPSLSLVGRRLYFLPDSILVEQRNTVSVVDYGKVVTTIGSVNFTAKGHPPDSTVIGTGWLYSNRDGTPDRRFANNQAFPIALYSTITMHELGVELVTSRQGATEPLCLILGALRNARASDEFETELHEL